MPPPAPVPPELTDMVVDHLHDDKPTLSACSLVSRSWLCSSRYHMFHTLNIRSLSVVEGFEKFLRFLDSAPDIWTFVKDLRLLGQIASNTPYTTHFCHLTPLALLSILSKLQSLRSLTLEGISWDGTEHNSRRSTAANTLAVIGALDTLTLRQVQPIRERRYQSFAPGSIHGVFQMFSSLRQLRLFDVQYYDPINSFFTAPASLPCLDLQDLTLNGACGSRYFVESIRGTQTLNTLRSLRIKSSGVSDAYSFRTLLRELASTLLHLELDMLDCRNPLFLDPLLMKSTFSSTITGCENLSSFHLRILLDHASSLVHSENFDQYRSGWPYVSTIISDLPTNLPSLTIFMVVPDKPSKRDILKLIEGAKWDEIRSGLAKLTELQALSFVVEAPHLPTMGPDELTKLRCDVHSAISTHLSSFVDSEKLILL